MRHYTLRPGLTLPLMLLALAMALCLATDCKAEDRALKKGMDSGRKTSASQRQYSKYIALVTGAGRYGHGAWPTLPNPAEDAREVAEALSDLGFNVTLVLEPGSMELRDALDKLLISAEDKRSAVLFYYAGHGYTLTEADGAKLGYLVPTDTPDPQADKLGFIKRALSMRDMEQYSKLMQARHVLMVFDSCFSGSLFTSLRGAPSRTIADKLAYPVRQFITAGTENETVPDKSVFKDVFLQGVREAMADSNTDGFVTGEELGAYIQEKVEVYSNQAQHPQYGKINNPKLDKGDFVFPIKGQRKGSLRIVENRPQGPQSPQAPDQDGPDTPRLPYKDPNRIRQDAQVMIITDPPGARAFIDGEDRGQTPLMLSLARRPHRVRLIRQGYVEEDRTFDPAERVSETVVFRLRRPSALSITTDPPGAKIFINGSPVGFSPYDARNLTPTSYLIEARMEDYKAAMANITAREGMVEPVALKLAYIERPRQVEGMVLVEGGCFMMGCPRGSLSAHCEVDESPGHEVCLPDFYIGAREVTWAEWAEVMGINKSEGCNTCPVAGVTWESARRYAEELARKTGLPYRLPTEAEWEYAARERGREVLFGTGSDTISDSEANFDADAKYRQAYSKAGQARGKTLPVASFAPNKLGLFDISGNVMEWVGDWYGEDYYSHSPKDNPTGPASGKYRVLRGGSYDFGPRNLRNTFRYWETPDTSRPGIGFRLALPSLPQSAPPAQGR